VTFGITDPGAPAAYGMAQNQQFGEVLWMPAEQRRIHMQRVDQAIQEISAKPHAVQSKVVPGLQQELLEVFDGCVTGGAIRAQHNEIEQRVHPRRYGVLAARQLFQSTRGQHPRGRIAIGRATWTRL
jgi:hypothetical protein